MTRTETLEIQRQLWGLQRTFYRPPALKAIAKPAVGNSEVLCPFSGSHSLTVVGYEPRPARGTRNPAVASLLGRR